MLSVVIYDDVVAARAETFELPGLDVRLYADADDAAATVAAMSPPPDLVCMDFAMGAGHKDGAAAIGELRAAGYRGRILATSSDPAANDRMLAAGADEALAQKALLRSYLVHLAGGGAGG
jgi:DNA-binding NarL/FixJ family response regulator